MEKGRTRTGKDWKEIQFVQTREKRRSNLRASYTPNSQLQRKYQIEIQQQGFKNKVVEKAGMAIKRLLQKSDPFKAQKCEREDCPVCRADEKGPCNRESVAYEIKCTECNNVYDGERSRSAYTGGKEHSKSLGNKEERSPLWKQCRRKHSSEIQQFQVNVTGVYSNDAILRQISEVVKINNVDEDSLIEVP